MISFSHVFHGKVPLQGGTIIIKLYITFLFNELDQGPALFACKQDPDLR